MSVWLVAGAALVLGFALGVVAAALLFMRLNPDPPMDRRGATDE